MPLRPAASLDDHEILSRPHATKWRGPAKDTKLDRQVAVNQELNGNRI